MNLPKVGKEDVLHDDFQWTRSVRFALIRVAAGGSSAVGVLVDASVMLLVRTSLVANVFESL